MSTKKKKKGKKERDQNETLIKKIKNKINKPKAKCEDERCCNCWGSFVQKHPGVCSLFSFL